MGFLIKMGEQVGPDVLTFPHIQYFNNISGMRIFFWGENIPIFLFIQYFNNIFNMGIFFCGEISISTRVVSGRPTSLDGNIRRRSVWYYQHMISKRNFVISISIFFWESPGLISNVSRRPTSLSDNKRT